MLREAVRWGVGSAALLTGGLVIRAVSGTPEALGALPSDIDAVTAGSPNLRDGVFSNPDGASGVALSPGDQLALVRDLFTGGARQQPPQPVPLVTPVPGLPPADLAATWFGHASVLLEIDGFRVLTDPMWSQRCSPSRAVGPLRLHPVPAELLTLPAIDAVVLSHDHYDHLDIDTVRTLAATQRAVFYAPLGVGAHLRAWGIPPERVVELDWNDSARLGDLTLTCTPARHFSGRFFTRNNTLWSSWVLAGPRHRVFFGGDTGYTRSFAEIGAAHGPFDLTLMPIGAYHTGWPDIHQNPEEAVRGHLDLAGARPDAPNGAGRAGGPLLPIHWATFRLAPHPWAEPADRLLAAAGEAGVQVVVPRPGERVEPGADHGADLPDTPWWRFGSG